MKELGAYLLVVCLALLCIVFLFHMIDPPEPVLLIDAKAPATPQKGGPLYLVLPPSIQRPVWCGTQPRARPHGYIEGV